MAERILNIEIGPNLTKVVETEDKVKGNKVYAAFSFPTPEGTMDNGELQTRPDEFRKVLDKHLRKNKIRTKKAVFVLQEARFGSREEQLPFMKDNKLKDYVETNGRMFFPVQGENMHIVSRKNGDGEPGKMRVQLYAIPERLIMSYEAVASYCGLSLVDIEISENGVAALLTKIAPKQVVFAAVVEESSMLVTIVKNGQIMMQRNVPYGIGEAIDTLREKNFFGENLDFHEVAERMKTRNCFYAKDDDAGETSSPNKEMKERAESDEKAEEASGNGKVITGNYPPKKKSSDNDYDGNDDYKDDDYRKSDYGFDESKSGSSPEEIEIRKEATEGLTYVFGNLTRMMEYYSSQNQNESIDVIYLGGLAGEIAGFKELLQLEIDRKVLSLVDGISAMMQKSGKGSFHLTDRYDAVVAGAFRPVGVMFSAGKKKKLGVGSDSENVRSAKLLCAVCVLIAAVLIAYPTAQKMMLQSEIDNLNGQIAGLSEAKQINNEYRDALNAYTALTNLDMTAESAGQYLPQLLSSLEEKLPTDVVVRSISAGEENGIAIAFTTSRRPVVEKTLQVFREIEVVENPVLSGVSVSTDEIGTKSFDFSITCHYISYIEEETEGKSKVEQGIENYTDGTDAIEAVENEMK